MTRREFLGNTGTAAGMLALPWLGTTRAAAQAVPEAEQRARIEAALPARAFASPRRPRRLLIYDGNVNYGGHPSARTANLAFTLMGQKTGAFETVVSHEPAVFKPESLRQYHAVFFNNTVGNLFQDAALRENLAEFIFGGGGLMGVHGTSVAFTQWPGALEDWPEFGLMLGARGANHRDSTEHVFIKLDDPRHPVNAPFGGQGFEYRDEFFRVHEPYSRRKLRVLFSIDMAQTEVQGAPRGNPIRADNDYALAWVRQYGRGRAFYCTIAHNPYVFWDPKMLQFYLAATQFALGDLPAPTTPSALLTPVTRALEGLGWRLGLLPPQAGSPTLFERIDQAAQAGLSHVSGSDLQGISPQIPGPFDGHLSGDALRQLRLKLDAAGVRLLAYRVHHPPADLAGWQRVFEFGRKIGIETIVGAPAPDALAPLEKLCDDFEINLALESHDARQPAAYARPEDVLKLCAGRSPRLGACGDVAAWIRAGLAPLETIRLLKERLLLLQLHDLNELSPRGQAVPWGTGVAHPEALLEELHRLHRHPTMIGVDSPPDGPGARSDLSGCVNFLNNTVLKLANEK